MLSRAPVLGVIQMPGVPGLLDLGATGMGNFIVKADSLIPSEESAIFLT